MTDSRPPKVLLVDPVGDADRTTATLLSSLATRLIVLHYTSGMSVVGSLLAGLTLAGQEAARTVEGARLRRALAAGPAAKNGEAIWMALRIGDMAAGLPATPVVEHVRNDLALLLAADVDKVLRELPAPPPLHGRPDTSSGEANFIDCLLGLWVHSREIVRSIEVLASLAPGVAPTFEGGSGDDTARSLLR